VYEALLDALVCSQCSRVRRYFKADTQTLVRPLTMSREELAVIRDAENPGLWAARVADTRDRLQRLAKRLASEGRDP
jgi:hypothetical protein